MSLPHAILGFLNYTPMTGYDLKKAFDTSVRHFWPADQAQIYRTLKDMTRQGWVTVEVVLQEDRPNCKVYHITDAGREELRRWLRTPTDSADPRVPLLVKVFFAGQITDNETVALLEAYAAGLRARLEAYARVPHQAAPCVEAIRSPREVFFWMLTLDYGVRLTRAALEWAEEAIHTIRNTQHGYATQGVNIEA